MAVRKEETAMKSKRMIGLIGFGLLVWLVPSIGTAATVNADCGDGGAGLQLAINAAVAGDTILVTGTCNENISIGETKEQITLNGGGTAVIDAVNNPNGHVITAMGRSIKIQGFLSIRGGLDGIHTPGYPPPGGGAKLHIENNIIENNSRMGINIGQNSYAVITKNTVRNNSSHGIAVSEMSSARIGVESLSGTATFPNTIQENGGDGIRITRSSYAIIVGNTISGNTASGIYVNKVSHADVASNTIDNNGEYGIFVTENSGVNLGSTTGDTIYDLPNVTSDNAKNVLHGVRATVGAYVTGRRGTLKGLKGSISKATGGINSTIP
jgi:parallel beta-helix repeat protein